MISFSVFFKIHFDSDRISDDDIKRYTQSHIERVTVNNVNHKYDAMLAATTAAYDNYYNAISAESTNEGIKQSATKSVDTILAEFKAEVSSMEGVITRAFRTEPSKIEEFFPFGLSEYSNATKSNVEMLMDRMVNACGNNSGKLPADFDLQVKAIRQSYTDLRKVQLRKIGTVADDKARAATNRNILERQLMLNLLDLAKEYLGDPVNGLKFFDQSILKTEASKPGEPGPDGIIYTGQVAPGAKVMVTEGGFGATSVITVENAGDVPLKVYTAAKADDPVPENAPELQPGEEDEFTPAQLGAAGNTFLMVYNPDKGLNGDYVVEVK
jgi:hypothetical protein